MSVGERTGSKRKQTNTCFRLPARGVNSAPLKAYPDRRVGGKKIIGEEKENEGNKHRKLDRGRQKEGEIREGNKDRMMGKRKEMHVEK